MHGIGASAPGDARTGLKGLFGRLYAWLRQERPPTVNPSFRLCYFDEVLATEHFLINKRRKHRPDAHDHPKARKKICKLIPDEHHQAGDHVRPTSGKLPKPTGTPKMDVDPARLDSHRMRPRPIPCTAVGIALSGGGIRSAAFSLGALQALDYHHVVAHADYISTVSGGGYIGACVTAAMSEGKGGFPFGTSDVRDNDALGHIRNYSNYLLPRARSQARNLLEVAAVLLRGLLANGILVFTFLLAAALLTSLRYSTWDELPLGNFLLKAITPDAWFHAFYCHVAAGFPDYAAPFVFTLILAAIVAALLILWAVVRSRWDNTWNDVDSPYLKFAWVLLGVVLLSAFLDLQPLAIHALGVLHLQPIDLGSKVLAILSQVVVIVAGASVALFARRLGAFLETTKLSPSILVRALRILTRTTIIAGGLVLPVVVLAAYWYLTACLYKESGVPQLVGAGAAFWLDVGMLVLLIGILPLFQANAYSLHQFYKDRLSKAFLFVPDFTGKADPPPLLNFKLSEISTLRGPYHIINAALNVQGSKEANRRGRNADFFTFTRDFVGSDLTHFVTTADNAHGKGMEKMDPRLDLGSAMAISGAAISANMGSNTVRWLSPTLALLNIRLGYWLRNPRDLGKLARLGASLREWGNAMFGKFYLLLEMFNTLDEEKAFIYLSDGGHIENLGIYQLLKRGCRLIIAIDADPDISCASLLKLERYARIDLGVRIILPWEQIRQRHRQTSIAISPVTPEEATRRRGPHCAVGRILYEDGSYGILLYFKSSLSGDEKDYLIDYKKRFRDFPHETTGDQFFTEEQFEVYRALGYHVVEGYFSDSDEVSYQCDGQRAWQTLHAAKIEGRQALGWI
jgi:hypothetical protein